MEYDDKAEKDEEVAPPKIGDVEVVALADIVVAPHGTAARLGAEDRAHLVGSDSVTVVKQSARQP